MDVSPGQKISNYEILGPLGAGAMGAVYRARDTRLEREVAIKVLPETWADDAERKVRFENEAKSLASLNHPNIAQVYGLEAVGDASLLVMELVEGETLSDRIAGRPLPVEDALALCRQVAEGLESAHEVNVIHRDLKPANVQITPNGVAKILDFGLAKSLPPGPERDDMADSALTATGALLGTPIYMSPEQIRGRPVNRRADIWAFGCLLYESLTGRRAFAGASFSDVAAAILGSDPDWSAIPEAAPPHVVRLLRRCLDKDPRQRLCDIGEARIALEHPPVELASAPGAPRSGVGVPVLLVTALVVAVATIFATNAFGRVEAFPNPIEDAKFVPLTTYDGTEHNAVISPDGKLVAFVSDVAGKFDAFVGPIGGRGFTNITNGTVAMFRTWVREIGFDQTGNMVWLTGSRHRRLRFVPVVGGAPASNPFPADAINIDWSPKGDRFVYHTLAPGDPIYVGDRNETPKEPIRRAKRGIHQHYPTWSTDGEWIYFVRGRPATRDMHLWRMRPDGTDPEPLTDDRLGVRTPAPIDAKTVLFIAKEQSGAGPWLWALDVESKVSRRVTVGLEQFTSIAASDDGRRLVATVAKPKARLWRVPIRNEVVKESEVRRLDIPSSLRATAPRSTPQGLFFLSSHGTADGLWRYRDGDEEPREIVPGADGALFEPASISPDGKRVAFVLRMGERRSLYTMDVDGTDKRMVSKRLDVRGCPAWSRHDNGRFLFIGGVEPRDRRGLYRIDVANEEVEAIVRTEALDPACSPTEDLIVYGGQQVNYAFPLLAVNSEGKPVDLGAKIECFRGGQRARFLPDGSGLVYMQGVGFQQDFWHLDLKTKAKRRLTELKSVATTLAFDVDHDGESIVFERIDENSDIVLIDRGPAATGK